MKTRTKFILSWVIGATLLFFSLFYVNECKAQLYSETFDTFIPSTLTTADSVVGLWIFDDTYSGVSGTALNEDYSAYSNDFTINGWASEAVLGDSCLGSSPLYSGGTTLHFDGIAANDLSIAGASATDFEMGLELFTVEVMVAPTDAPGDDGGIWTKNRGIGDGTAGAYGLLVNDVTADRIDAKYSDGASRNVAIVDEQWGGVWQYIAYFRPNADSLQTQLNGNTRPTKASAGVSGLELNGDNTTQRNVVIGNDAATSTPFEGYIAWARVSRNLLTRQQMNEAWALATNWSSSGGNVTRQYDGGGLNFQFHQGFYDSEIVTDPMGLTAVSSADSVWIIQVDAKSAVDPATMSVWIGTATNKRVTQVDVPLTSTSATKTITLDNTALLATDGIVFQSSAGDTVYIDNVKLYRGYSQQAVDRDRYLRNSKGGYLKY